ncbi:MAG TPA: hypothetical protein VEU08_09305 [Vicinamibacterales bacterium]|nr:hypothetical protein [Vicinamibacterales bacterium]
MKSHAIVTAAEAALVPYPYVFVENDGSARELHADERTYLETPYLPTDGARPYVKSSYDVRDGWGSLAGFLLRSKLPAGTDVRPAPPENPSKPMNEEEFREFLRKRGKLIERHEP